VQCRLKDIQNLFMDTGISTDSYAIIELGMVDDLIKDKDNSRRRMLEQAAGISIYKTRKKEAKLKLDATEQDLARIEDLLFEINNQLKMLESQAKKAEKYLEIKKEYREVSIELAKASLEGFNDTYKALHEQQETEEDKRIGLEADIATREADLEQQRVFFIEQEKELHAVQQAFNALVQQARTREGEKNLAAQRLEHLKERVGNLNDFLSKASGRIAGTKESIQFTEQQLLEENNVLTQLTAQLEETRSAVDAKRSVLDEKRTALNGFRTTFQQVQRSQFDAEKKVAIGDTSIQNLERAVRQVEEDRATREAQKASIEKEIESTDKELNTRKEALEVLQLHHNKTKEQILQTQSGLESLRQQLTDENRKLDAKKNEYDLLKSMIDSMEGYPESIKFLHNNKGWNHAAPILTDIIYVTEEYRAAVENVLEPYLNYYVVNSLAEGLQAVHLLDGAKKGKANFFLLDKVGSVEAENHGTPAGTIPAMSVIEVDEPYRKLAEQLLGNVFIAHDEAALQNSNGAVILERHGRYVKGTYTLKGGSVGWFEGKKIGRAKNLEKLHEEMVLRQGIVADFKTQIAAKHNEVNALNGELKEGAIREAERAIQQQNNQLFALQNRLENLHHAQVQSGNRLGDLHGQLETTKTSVHSIRSELAALNNQLAEHAASMHQAEKDYQTIELGYNEVNTLYNAMNLNVTRQQSKIAALKQELQFKTNGLNDLHQQAAINTKQLEETTINVASVEADLKGLLENLHQLMRNKETAELNLNTKDQAYYNLRNSIRF
jgi:chromosome segregation protein